MSIARVIAGALTLPLLLVACTSAASNQRRYFEEAEALRKSADALPGPGAGAPPKEPSRIPTADKGEVTLEELAREAELHSPQLAAAFEKWRASVERITVATDLPPAMFGYAEFIRSLETRLGPIERRFMFDQTVPNPGKLVFREEAAAGEAAAMKANFEAARLGVREAVSVAYIDVQALDRRAEILSRMAELLASVESVVETRIAVNLAPQSMLLRVQVEKERVRSDLESLRLRRPAMVSMLVAASGVALQPDVKLEPLPEQWGEELPDQALLTALALEHPSLQMDLAKVAVARAKRGEATWMWVPDFMFGLEYQMIGDPDVPAMMRPDEAGEDTVAVRFGISIPWGVHAHLARGNAAEAEERAARYLVEQRKLDLRARLDGQLFASRDADRMASLYDETVLPKARQTLELVQADFVADRATLTDVLDAERMLLASELALVNARADQLRSRARLASLVGRDLSNLPKR